MSLLESAEQTRTIQEVAKETGLSVHTLRFYERSGLIAPIPRDTHSGHRRYTTDDIRRIGFLMKLRATGMPLREMEQFVRLYWQGDATLPERIAMLESHRCTVRGHIEELQQHLLTIENKIQMYSQALDGQKMTGDCTDQTTQILGKDREAE
jgi:DNA-binding transcriptional MerR regulator